MESGPILADTRFVFQSLQPSGRPFQSFYGSIWERSLAVTERTWAELVDLLWTDRNLIPADPTERADLVDRLALRRVAGFEGLSAAERIRIADTMDLRPDLAELVYVARREGCPVGTFSKELIAYAERTRLPIVTLRWD